MSSPWRNSGPAGDRRDPGKPQILPRAAAGDRQRGGRGESAAFFVDLSPSASKPGSARSRGGTVKFDRPRDSSIRAMRLGASPADVARDNGMRGAGGAVQPPPRLVSAGSAARRLEQISLGTMPINPGRSFSGYMDFNHPTAGGTPQPSAPPPRQPGERPAGAGHSAFRASRASRAPFAASEQLAASPRASPDLSARPLAAPAGARFSRDSTFSRDMPPKRLVGQGALQGAVAAGRGLCGLANLGNTCFMNSVIQCLSNTEPLTSYFVAGQHAGEINTNGIGRTKGGLAQAYAKLVSEIWARDKNFTVVPRDFKQAIGRFAPQFSGYRQHDSQEFLCFLLDGLHEDLNRVTTKVPYTELDIPNHLPMAQRAAIADDWHRQRNSSFVMDLFSGQLRSTLRCTHCGTESVTFDPYWSLSLPIPLQHSSIRPSAPRTCTLADCLAEFLKEETLESDEAPTCEECKKRRKCTKQLAVQRLPPLLVFHIKRFSSARSKLGTDVKFPIDGLDLSMHGAQQGGVYDLVGVSSHSGGMGGGHYTAYCRHPVSKEWGLYNDSRITSITAATVGGPGAYILFYQRRA